MSEAVERQPQLAKHKVNYKKPFQRACKELDEKGKICGGHLKTLALHRRRSGAGLRRCSAGHW
jgi:hypothetical protein